MVKAYTKMCFSWDYGSFDEKRYLKSNLIGNVANNCEVGQVVENDQNKRVIQLHFLGENDQDKECLIDDSHKNARYVQK